jgi:hypothetical protein
MKKIFAILLCLFIICAMPLMASAQSNLMMVEDSIPEEEIPPVIDEEIPEEIPEETPEEIPPVDTVEPQPTPEPAPTPEDTSSQTLAQQIEEWIVARLDDIAVVVTLVCTILFNIVKAKSDKTFIKKLNNNAIAIAENSKEYVGTALAGVENTTNTLQTYVALMNEVLETARKNSAENKTLVTFITEVEGCLKTAVSANKEFANELAELLNLANIPNSLKDKLYERHQAAIDALDEQEKAVAGLLSTVEPIVEEDKKDVEEG